MDYEKKYKEALELARDYHKANLMLYKADENLILEDIFPALKESEDERIRKEIVRFIRMEVEDEIVGNKWIAWLEKQREKPQGKTAFEAIKEKPADNANKVEPKLKVKYAGSEYDVLEIKEFPGGIIYYGIEDEPNHIDYVLPENCEIISGYGVKEKGNSYPIKSAIFSQQNSAWSEEDEDFFNDTIAFLEDARDCRQNALDCIDWLKSLKDRCTWKPSDEQIKALEHFVRGIGESGYVSPYDANLKLVHSLLNDLKKLK